MAFSMTLLSWSVIEYGHKYKAIGEYNHVREIIKWGIDYLLLTFNSSASTINKIYSQVGAAKVGSTSPDDHFCWQRPEDMEYPRPVQIASVAPDLASEIAAALAAASIVFQEEPKYSKKLVHAAKIAYKFAIVSSQQTAYSVENNASVPFYNSSGFWDELIWGATWMYYATGNYSYLSLATSPTLPNNANAFSQIPYLSVFSWDNKLPGAELLLVRLRIVLNPGYPYEEMLRAYHKTVDFNMCSLLQMFKIFKYSKGGLIQLNRRNLQPLPYAVNAAFLATLYADYMNDSNIPGWYCGASYISALTLRKFAASQVKYILGANPMNMSYVVGYGQNFPSHVHHRGASIPSNQRHVSCTEGWKWRDARTPNPHIITGAMVGGPNQMDQFVDKRQNYNFTEPTIAGNAGLVAALVALTSGSGRNSILN
ncbi:endoglucanase 12-like [Dendrobium catenatum]|uniref:Endoglucanase n=1 Tax=Dendrobium catenatum TaxID=906689 RepID=A0A2I0WKC0_9ASPA|nr:endoglucanase 12-like [Dendrobium catenatum]PKU76103.1 Endoglucanase 12 [Dendrobium catenatum]